MVGLVWGLDWGRHRWRLQVWDRGRSPLRSCQMLHLDFTHTQKRWTASFLFSIPYTEAPV